MIKLIFGVALVCVFTFLNCRKAHIHYSDNYQYQFDFCAGAITQPDVKALQAEVLKVTIETQIELKQLQNQVWRTASDPGLQISKQK